MKVGLIVECTPSGMESIVCPKLIALLAQETGQPIELHAVRTMTNKKLLINDAADAAKILLSEGCDRVVVLWDENPPWSPDEDFADERCWHIERQQLIENLGAAKVNPKRIRLVCIEREFETWLLHDDALISTVVSTQNHPYKAKSTPNPVTIADPKAALEKHYRNNHRSFNPDVAAVSFAQNIDSLNRLKKCDTFRYFAQAILGRMPANWQPYVYQPKGPRRKAKKGK